MQQEVLTAIKTSMHKYYCLATGRQAGKSLIAMVTAIMWALENTRVKIAWIAPTVKHYQRCFDEINEVLKDTGLIKKSLSSKGSMSIKFATDSVIEFYNTALIEKSPIRGGTFDYGIIDEAAFISDDFFYNVISATFDLKGRKILILSTPKKKNWFYQMYKQGSEPNEMFWSKRVNSLCNPYFRTEIYEMKKKLLPELAFKQEYEAEFLDSGGEVFQDLDKFFTLKTIQPYKKVFIGIDVGFTQDFTVVTVISDKGEVIDIQRFNSEDTTLVIKKIKNLLAQYKEFNAYIESNSIGRPIFDQIKKDYKNIEAFVTTNETKTTMLTELRLAMQDNKIKCQEHPILRDELEKFEFDLTLTGKLSFSAPAGFHDDCVISLAIAHKCYKDKSNFNFSWYSV